MHVFELTRALIDIPSVTPEEERVGLYLFDYLRRLARQSRRHGRENRSRAAPLQRLRRFGDSRRHALHSHGYRAALRPFARRRRIHLGPRRLRHQRHHRRHAHRRRAPARTRRARFRPALRRRRRAQQRRRLSRRAQHPRGSQLHHQRRAHREPAGARLQRRAAL